MGILDKIRRFRIKLFSWEYWPTGVVYLPIKIYSIWLALKARTVTFFAIANPLIETGGLFGASKIKQLNHLPSDIKPITLLFEKNTSLLKNNEVLSAHQILFPFIAKPDRAERGVGVALIKNSQQWNDYIDTAGFDFIVQEYIDFPFEAGVFYIRLPGHDMGSVPSLVLKDFLSLCGDGVHSIEELINANDRAFLVKDKLEKKLGNEFNTVLAKGEIRLMEPIGNHNRGTKFVNGNKFINHDFEKTIDTIAKNIPEFYYGRFDLRAPSLEDLLAGKNIKIVEVNGVNAEPAHIYDPTVSYFEGLKTLFKHWNYIYEISRVNKKRGFKDIPFSEVKFYWQLRKPFLNQVKA